MNSTTDENTFLFHLTSDLYKKPHIEKPPAHKINITTLLDLAMKNNMLFYVAKMLQEKHIDQLSNDNAVLIKKIVERGKEEIERTNRAVSTVNSSLDNYVSIKTYRGYPRIPNDIDILVEDFNEATRSLTKNGMDIKESSPRQAVLIKDGLTKIHLHKKISWCNTEFLDNELFWTKNKKVNFNGIKTSIPNENADFLVHLAHINFEPLHITLSELLYIYKLVDKVNFSDIFEQANKYGWGRTLKRTLELLDTMHHTLYSGNCPFSGVELKHRAKKDQNYFAMPKMLPRIHIINSFIEKKLISYVSRKAAKSMYILFTGDTYQRFYQSPEHNLIE
jgi:hypothetical protein